jgi:hypothetical protein
VQRGRKLRKTQDIYNICCPFFKTKVASARHAVLALSYSSKINIYHQRVSPPLKKMP